MASFPSLRKQNGLAGFPKQSESPHDAFNTGHASTSISASLGLLAADRLLGGNNLMIAVIGDGALTGGLAYEALSHAGHLGLPLIVILNDNKMSISPNVGGLSKYLSRLSMKGKYQTFRRHFDAMVKKIPLAGEAVFNLIVRLKRAVKAVFYSDNFFVDLGFEYVGPIGGHNIQALVNVLEDVRNMLQNSPRKLNRPVVVHINTRKGKGYLYAEDDPDSYHGVGSFSIDGGIPNGKETAPVDADAAESGISREANKRKSFTEAFSGVILEQARKDNRITAVTAAMKTGTGLLAFAKNFPNRFFDVGIAEGHAVTFASGLAARGLKPVVAVYSTFIQRSVDQVIHDAALQKLPVIIALDRSGFVGADGETHQGLFDISIFRSTPNMTILSPTSENEMRLMFEWALGIDETRLSADIADLHGLIKKEGEKVISGPVIIRYPKALCPEEIDAFSQPVQRGRGVWVAKNEYSKNEVCLVFTGSLYSEAQKAGEILKEKGINIDLYNIRFLKPVDEDYLCGIMNDYKLICIMEEGIKDGGFGEYAATLALQRKCGAHVQVMAALNLFLEEDRALGTREELLAENGLDAKSAAEAVYNTARGIIYEHIGDN